MTFALLAAVALQAPPAPAAAPNPPPAPKTDASKPETLDEQIRRALATHPDLRAARAQVELAQAKLEQERLRLAQRVRTARAGREAAAADVAQAQIEAANTAKLQLKAVVTEAEVKLAENKLAKAKELLAVADAELVAATGGPPKSQAPAVSDADVTPFRLETGPARTFVYRGVQGEIQFTRPAAPGDFRSDFADMLDRRITPAKKDGTAHELLHQLVNKAIDGRPLPAVRVSETLDRLNAGVPRLALQGDGLTLGAWLEQLQDALAGSAAVRNTPHTFTLYVRDYGLLLAPAKEAPAGAETVAAFWDRARAEKAARDKAPPPAKK